MKSIDLEQRKGAEQEEIFGDIEVEKNKRV